MWGFVSLRQQVTFRGTIVEIKQHLCDMILTSFVPPQLKTFQFIMCLAGSLISNEWGISSRILSDALASSYHLSGPRGRHLTAGIILTGNPDKPSCVGMSASNLMMGK